MRHRGLRAKNRRPETFSADFGETRAAAWAVTEASWVPIAVAASFRDYVADAPKADLHLFGLQPEADFDLMRTLVRATRSSALFVRDSGQESVLA